VSSNSSFISSNWLRDDIITSSKMGSASSSIRPRLVRERSSQKTVQIHPIWSPGSLLISTLSNYDLQITQIMILNSNTIQDHSFGSLKLLPQLIRIKYN
jgi:hypothetical protein